MGEGGAEIHGRPEGGRERRRVVLSTGREKSLTMVVHSAPLKKKKLGRGEKEVCQVTKREEGGSLIERPGKLKPAAID